MTVTPNYTRRRFLALASAGLAGSLGYAAISNRLDAARSTAPGAVPRRPIRIAVASDMHAPHVHVDLEELTAAVHGFDPHLLFVTGDAIDGRGHERELSFYERLPARAGKFACLGNWEYWGHCDMSAVRREYDRAGVRLLVNERAALECGGELFDIVGLDDFRASRPDYALLRDTPALTEARRLILSHCPVTFDAITRVGDHPADTFAGHTHGGQIAPFGLALFTPRGSGRYVAGWYTAPGGHRMYVSRGLGNSGLPFRIGSQPEIALLTV
ncbi:MAG: metallophosphoesterase [Gemmatimonadota bacterium]|nr:metallophosphoesterase [Gemmatimonadota bacterium]